MGYSPWGCKESHMTEQLTLHTSSLVILCLRIPQQGMQVQSLLRKDPLEKGMATESSILAWRISWTEEPGGLQSMGSQSA